MRKYKILSLILAGLILASAASCAGQGQHDSETETGKEQSIETEKQTETDGGQKEPQSQDETQKDTESDTDPQTQTEHDPETQDPHTQSGSETGPSQQGGDEEEGFYSLEEIRAKEALSAAMEQLRRTDVLQSANLRSMTVNGEDFFVLAFVKYDGGTISKSTSGATGVSRQILTKTDYYLTDGESYAYRVPLSELQYQKLAAVVNEHIAFLFDPQDYDGIAGIQREDGTYAIDSRTVSANVSRKYAAAIKNAMKISQPKSVSVSGMEAGFYLLGDGTMKSCSFRISFEALLEDGTTLNGYMLDTVVFNEGNDTVDVPSDLSGFTEFSYEDLTGESDEDLSREIELGIFSGADSFVLDEESGELAGAQADYMEEHGDKYTGKRVTVTGTVKETGTDEHLAGLAVGQKTLELYFVDPAGKPGDGKTVRVTAVITPRAEYYGASAEGYLYVVLSCEILQQEIEFSPVLDRVLILTDGTQIFEEPGRDPVGTVRAGTEYIRTGYDPEWTKVKDDQGNVFYVRTADCAVMTSEIPFTEPIVMEVYNCNYLWLHYTPDFEESSRIQQELAAGTRLIAIAQHENGLYKVIYGDNNETAYVSRKYLKRVDP
ncbi:MAG: hypothetical protein IJR83_05455 [Clostridia bacterium]|nr:hypothetical protein [Clostridia bacterium]